MAQLHLSDLRGLTRLGVDGVTATTELVEHLHHSITRVPVLQRVAGQARTRGITGLVYRSIHGVNGLVGKSLDLALGAVASTPDPAHAAPERARVLAILNGVLGDHLEATGNPLATPMTLLRDNGAAVESAADGEDAGAGSGRRIAVLLHGLCLDERSWRRGTGASETVPAALQRAGWSVLQLRYNTGRPIHANGAEFAKAMQGLVESWPVPMDELALVGHSMGGLVARSAAHQAIDAGQDWIERLGPMVFLGTPHLGSPLERAGHIVDRALGLSRYSAPFARLGRMRSAGITDLRHGKLLNDEPDAPARLPPGCRCHAVAATLDENPDSRRSRYIGDGLVPVPSALGRHPAEARRLPLAPDDFAVITGSGHLELLQHPEAVRRVVDWLG